MENGKFHAVIMAAQRAGVINELAVDAGVSHKCLIEMGGKKLIEHVTHCLADTPEVGFITVSIDTTSTLDGIPIIETLKQAGRLRVVEAGKSLFESFRLAVSEDEHTPAIITTADNVLLTPAMVQHFTSCMIGSGQSAALAIVKKEVLLAKYPEGQKKFHRFKDGEYSNCNLYGVMNMRAVDAGRMFETGGQFAKKPQRVLKAFGFWNALAYRFALYTLDKAMYRLGKRFGVTCTAVRMPFPEAPIDVDNFRTKGIAGEILAVRQAAEEN